MNRPRLFLSADSEELRSARKNVAATVRSLGFDPVSQDDFPTGHGELREWLREQIDSCEGLIQLVGRGYGAEPPEVDPDYGRVSYTQLEFLYARRQGKKTWVIVAGEGCRRDKPIDELDLPREAMLPHPAGYQAERQKLQQDYVARLTGENHLRHTANNDTELQNIVLRLRDELGELRRQWDEWLKKDANFKASTTAQLEEIAEAARLTTEIIRAHLLQTAGETHRRELAEADAPKEWKERQRLREAADSAHEARLSRIEELAATFAEIEGRGTATSVFKEMTRILTEQGVDEAIAYVAAQRPSILKTVRARAAATRERNRADLQPLLQAAGLHEAKGQAPAARTLYTDILGADPDWPEALHSAFWFHANQGEIACVRTTLADARRDYAEARRLAQRLTTADPGNTLWQSDLAVSYERLGNVEVAQGKLEKAAHAFGDSQGIAKKLAAHDPSNTQWQRDLAVSCNKLGDVAAAQGKLEEAARAFGDGLEIVKKLSAVDPSNFLWQRDLAISYNRLGDVAVAQGKLEKAARAFGDGLEIVKKLSAVDPSNTLWQRDLAISYEKIGDVTVAQGKLEKAARAFGDGLEIVKKLSAVDPSNTEWQRDLAVSCNKLGDVAVAQGKLQEAASAYGDSLGIVKKLSAVDPSNTLWHSDLAISYNRLGDVAAAQGKLEEATRAYRDSLGIVKKLSAADPSNTLWQRNLAVSCNKLGDVGAAQGKLEEAARAYRDSMKIVKKLATVDPSNTLWQRDLAVSCNKLGDVAGAQGQLEEAARAYSDSIGIVKKLAAGDPSNTLWQRDLAVSYWRLADLAERQNKTGEAKGYWNQAYDMLSGIEKQGLHLSPQDRQNLETLRRKSDAAP